MFFIFFLFIFAFLVIRGTWFYILFRRKSQFAFTLNTYLIFGNVILGRKECFLSITRHETDKLLACVCFFPLS